VQHQRLEQRRLLPVNDAASPARGRRRRGCSALALLIVAALTGVASAAPVAGPSPSPAAQWSIARRFEGVDWGGELGFRFGEPLDMDGDGHPDVAAGARFKRQQKTQENGTVLVWSGATGALIRSWDGTWPDGLFGHWVMPIPDVSGDGLADVVIAAPHGTVGGPMRGILTARSPKTGKEIWTRVETESENLGWDLTLAGDQNGDRFVDLFVGAPAADSGRVYLLSGRDGAVLKTYSPERRGGSFGWYVARLDDLDGDGRPDLAVGGPYAADEQGTPVGSAWVLSSATGRELQRWNGTDRRGGFGGVVAAVADLDGDGKGDVAVGAPATEDQTRSLPGEAFVYSSVTGKELRHWTGSQPGELYGRMIVSTGDLDGDGVDDLAIGAPAYRRGSSDRVGRVEFRSGRSGEVIGELFGDGPECWFGWHIRRAPDPDGLGRPALLIGSLRHPVGELPNAGVIDLYVLHSAKRRHAHGTTTRGTRRSDIK
jgi:hypothetical protein